MRPLNFRIPRHWLVVLGSCTVGLTLAIAAAALGNRWLGSAALAPLAGNPVQEPPRRSRPAQSLPSKGLSLAATTIHRQSAMTPLQATWMPGQPGKYGYQRRGMPGASSGPAQWGGRLGRAFGGGDDDDDEDRPRPSTYRTLCVRLCDGYYFPVSFSAPRERFAQDARACEARCGSAARLFVYPNPGGNLEDMTDLKGQPYRQLRTAFLYRTEYLASCRCQPEPWEAQARERHRAYALAAAARKGDKAAQKQLETLQARPPKLARIDGGKDQARQASPAPQSPAGAPSKALQVAQEDTGRIMRLGAEGKSKSRPAPASGSDWRRKVFDSGH